MIIFSSIELEKALADQKVTRWQKAKYIIIFRYKILFQDKRKY